MVREEQKQKNLHKLRDPIKFEKFQQKVCGNQEKVAEKENSAWHKTNRGRQKQKIMAKNATGKKW